MSNMIKELKKGNQTLTIKVRDLEEIIEFQNKEISELRLENNSLKQQISKSDKKQVIQELELINYFCGIHGNLMEIFTKDIKEIQKNEKGDI